MTAREDLLTGMRTAVLASPLAEGVRYHDGGGDAYEELFAVVSFGPSLEVNAPTDQVDRSSATVRIAERAIGKRDQVSLRIAGDWVRYNVSSVSRRVGRFVYLDCVRVEPLAGSRPGWRGRV